MKKITEPPFIRFPGDWEIQLVPAYLGIHDHFRVRLPSGEVKSVVLLQNDEGYAYWQVYPVYGDEEKCDFDDVTTLLLLIGSER